MCKENHKHSENFSTTAHLILLTSKRGITAVKGAALCQRDIYIMDAKGFTTKRFKYLSKVVCTVGEIIQNMQLYDSWNFMLML